MKQFTHYTPEEARKNWGVTEFNDIETFANQMEGWLGIS